MFAAARVARTIKAKYSLEKSSRLAKVFLEIRKRFRLFFYFLPHPLTN